MSDDPRDLVHYLPLSARPRVDESAVTNDWGAKLELLQAAVAGLGGDHTEFDALVTTARRRRRVGVGDLGAALVAAYDLGDVEVDGVTSGGVALARALVAPLAIRAVIRDRSLHATDAGWEFGTGPRLAGTAREIVLFLYGRAGVPGS